MVPIIKVVGNFCNLRCNYCFYHENDQSKPTIMKYDLLEKFIIEYLELFSGRINFIWHGGEPLLAGISFFERVIDLQKKYVKEKHIIRNSIQTNATLINVEWAKFFKNNKFKVGISIDGDKRSHNNFRKDKKGAGSFDRVIKGIRTLQEYNVKLGFIQTLTTANITNLNDDFDFFVDSLGVQSWGINHYFISDKNNGSDLSKQQITNTELIDYLKSCVDLWLAENDPKLRLREIDNYIAGVIGKTSNSCSFNGSCTAYFCLDYDGKIYPCDRFSGQDNFLFGDFSKQSLFEILNGDMRLKYAKDVNTVPIDCLTCKWQQFCNNGCTHYRVNNIKGKYYFCETRKNLFNYLENIVKECQLNNLKEVSK
jgi:uncharacterized protein